MASARRLALEHLTVPSASPVEVVELAARQGWAAATVLLAPFAPFPQTGGVDLVGDAAARRDVRRAAGEAGVTLALAYPFVLTPRTGAIAFRPALEAAAAIGARGGGVLIYDRDPLRAEAQLQAFCGLASEVGVAPVLEFYAGSAVGTLEAADALAARCAPAQVGLCVDLLHLVRSGGEVAGLAAVQARVAHAQLSDAPRAPTLDPDWEAAYGRLGPGEGELDVAAFLGALPEHAWIGLEVPPHGLTRDEELARALRLMSSTALHPGFSEAAGP